MERRKFTIGLGALVTGSAAAMGTGAFSSVEANRSVNIAVEEDSNAFLSLEVLDGDRASEDSSGISLDFEEGHGGSSGLNPNSGTSFRGVLEITNQGTNDVVIGADVSSIVDLGGIDNASVYYAPLDSAGELASPNPQSGNPDNEDNIAFGGSYNGYPIDFSTFRPLVESNPQSSTTVDNATLSPGEGGELSFRFDTGDFDDTEDFSDVEITFAAVVPERTN